MKIMLFTEGTILMHKDGISESREKRISQVKLLNPTVKDYSTYVPIENAVNKITK